MTDRERDLDDGWATDRAAKRSSWLSLSPGERLRWLEDALTFAAGHGALDRDRARRRERAGPQPGNP